MPFSDLRGRVIAFKAQSKSGIVMLMGAMQIIRIERNIRQVKMLHNLGKIPVKDAKKEILRLSAEFNKIIDGLPAAERSLYQRKRIALN